MSYASPITKKRNRNVMVFHTPESLYEDTKVIAEKPELADWWIAQEEKIRKHKEKIGSKYNSQFKNNISFIELKEQALAPKQPTFFDDEGTSCFCTD